MKIKTKNYYIWLIPLLVPLAFLLVLNGCGKRGDPKPINNEKVYYPKKYPTH
jgi:hypothetical protein